MGMSGTEVAQALNYRVQTVHLIWHHWRRKGFEYLERSRPGGRKRAYLNEEEEKEFLSSFIAEAKRGGILVVSDIKKAFEERVGHSVVESTVYRLLARHGWRKVTPRKRHPKANPSVQEKAKKT
jgi:transposase